MDINVYIFQKINGLSGKNKWLDAVARAGGEFAIFGMIGWFFVILYLAGDFGPHFIYRGIAILACAMSAGWAINWIIAVIVHEPRPFITLNSDKEMFRPLFPSLFRWKSFPSDHSLFAFSIFFSALILHLPLAWPLLALAVWVGLGRIFAGVHYPGDIVGGLAVASAVAAVLNYLVSY